MDLIEILKAFFVLPIFSATLQPLLYSTASPPSLKHCDCFLPAKALKNGITYFAKSLFLSHYQIIFFLQHF